MKILIACEYSGRLREAFRKLGHDAWSCDILPSEDDSPFHIQGDVLSELDKWWDLMVAHPPCTYLAVSGMHWTTRGFRDKQLTEDALEFVQKLMDAQIPKIAIENPVSVISTRIRKPDQIIQPWMFGENASKKTCLWLKNLPKLSFKLPEVYPPKGWKTIVPVSEMRIDELTEEAFCDYHDKPYEDCACVAPNDYEEMSFKLNSGVLFGTEITPQPKMIWGNQTATGQNNLWSLPDRWKERSRTYQGVADAIAYQWG